MDKNEDVLVAIRNLETTIETEFASLKIWIQLLLSTQIDCNEYVNHVSAGFSRRGTRQSSFADRAIKEAKKWCEEENERRQRLLGLLETLSKE